MFSFSASASGSAAANPAPARSPPAWPCGVRTAGSCRSNLPSPANSTAGNSDAFAGLRPWRPAFHELCGCAGSRSFCISTNILAKRVWPIFTASAFNYLVGVRVSCDYFHTAKRFPCPAVVHVFRMAAYANCLVFAFIHALPPSGLFCFGSTSSFGNWLSGE